LARELKVLVENLVPELAFQGHDIKEVLYGLAEQDLRDHDDDRQRIPEADFSLWISAAAKRGITRADFVREALRRAAVRTLR